MYGNILVLLLKAALAQTPIATATKINTKIKINISFLRPFQF